ncbi:SseB family protein [Micromonospora lupini]|uniref:SseB family protein n=1 Tax=Micromonospora lupini TaxID=285679 RepID=UPI002250BA04|nr:SseB family protein [Micromonospora lupini]MCX5068738.1 SseB family protein [Micromonospora lupini]
MTEWEPATEAEVAMRDALRANDQELYFRLLSRTDLLLPVSTPAPPGQASAGWGTWTTGGRTHVLAFTSAAALRACLGEHSGTNRRIPFTDLALGWPNHEWWLAVNPGLPVEGYLPAWFVSQLSRGDVRLPGRAMGARARLERAETLARSRVGTTGRDASPTTAFAPPPPPAADPTPPGRPAPRTAVPPVGTPPASGIPTRSPGPGELSRRPGSEDLPAAGQRQPTAPPRPARPGVGPVPGASRTAASRYVPLASTDRTQVSPADQPGPRSDQPGPRAGRPSASRPASDGDGPAAGDGSTPGGRRSFFEPTTGRASGPVSTDGRSGDRAVPPSRFGRGSQPFPRRRPADAPGGDSAGPAFPMPTPDATRSLRPPAGDLGVSRVVRAPATDDEATQPLPPRRPNPLAEEPTHAFRVPGPAGGEPSPTRAGGPVSSADETQAIPRGRLGDRRRFEPVEELPPSVAEPVSGPPAPRRGFTPIVIEGTIIESRDLLDPSEAGPPFDAPRRPGPTTVAPPTFGPAAAAPPTFGPAAAAPPTFGPATVAPPAFGPAAAPPTFGPAEPDATVRGPSTLEPSTPGPSVSEPSVPSPDLFATPTSLHPASSGAGLFEPVDVGAGLRDDTDTGGGLRESAGTAAGLFGPAEGGPGGGDPLRTDIGRGVSEADRESEADLPDTGVTGGRAAADGRPALVDEPAPVQFEPANTVEEDLLGAAGAGSTDTFLSTLLLARVLLPASADSVRGSRPGDPGFVWRTAQLDGETYVVVYTSPERQADHVEGDVDTVRVKFAQLIRRWPDEDWSFAVNPGTPVGAKLPGDQIVALANWAAEVGLGDDLEVDPQEPAVEVEPAARTRYAPAAVDPARPTVMQKAIAPSQLAYYLERGYDRVSGFVHRAGELAHLTTPAELHDALGLSYPGSPFVRDAEEIYVLRWPAHRPSLYRIPYGGQNEPAMRAMEGWVIERAPFRGNGFAPGESSDVVAEFKVDSARLPHGAQLWRIGGDGTERVVAVLDTDAVVWRRVGEA